MSITLRAQAALNRGVQRVCTGPFLLANNRTGEDGIEFFAFVEQGQIRDANPNSAAVEEWDFIITDIVYKRLSAAWPFGGKYVVNRSTGAVYYIDSICAAEQYNAYTGIRIHTIKVTAGQE